jgi:glycosyltransferase involved in cell wall biosynthesis
MKYSLVLPSYNEEKNIKNIIEVIKQVKELTELIIVDDSDDSTPDIVKEHKDIKLIHNKNKQGKTRAVMQGVEVAKYENIVMTDADMIGMRPQFISNMIKEYETGYDMVILNKNEQPIFFTKILRSVPSLSGTRVLKKSILKKLPFRYEKPFELEFILNRYFLENNLTISFAEAPGSHDSRKYVKYRFWQGLLIDLKAAYNNLTVFGLRGIPGNINDMWTINNMYRIWTTERIKTQESLRAS